MEKCPFYEELCEQNLGDLLGEDEMGYSVFDSEITLIGVYCTKYNVYNPDCSQCKNSWGIPQEFFIFLHNCNI